MTKIFKKNLKKLLKMFWLWCEGMHKQQKETKNISIKKKYRIAFQPYKLWAVLMT